MNKIKSNIGLIIYSLILFLFPIIIETGLYFLTCNVTNFKWDFTEISKALFSTMKTYITFYGTTFTIFITVYSFNQKQKQLAEDRIKEQEKELELKQKEQEKELELKQKDQEKKRELKLKELEQYKDRYRPSFVVNDSKSIILIMREESLYIENIKYYNSSYNTKDFVYIPSLKSNEIIARNVPNSFYITATTIVGEEIIFGYLNGGTKIYKYLNTQTSNSEELNIEDSFTSEALVSPLSPESWRDYNRSNPINPNLAEIFFTNTLEIREHIYLNKTNLMNEIINSENFNQLLSSLFHFFELEIDTNRIKLPSVYSVLNDLLNNLIYETDLFGDTKTEVLRKEYLLEKEAYIRKKLPDAILYFHNLKDINDFFMMKFIASTRDNLNFLREKKEIDFSSERFTLRAIIAILLEIFDNTNVSKLGTTSFISLKTKIFNNIHFMD
ncbi:hypothetical protein M5J17_08395 [Streptococcus koreensis]|uniref:hypothetical protein n=1 Tax=Streptococcus koreensis TaxID=2382163 RepID=UPI003CECCA50